MKNKIRFRLESIDRMSARLTLSLSSKANLYLYSSESKSLSETNLHKVFKHSNFKGVLVCFDIRISAIYKGIVVSLYKDARRLVLFEFMYELSNSKLDPSLKASALIKTPENSLEFEILIFST